MKQEISPQQINAVLKLSDMERYEHFIKRVVDYETVWVLDQNGLAAMGTDDGRKIFPLWPEREYAEIFAATEFRGYKATPISLDHFMSVMLPNLANDNGKPGIFPIPGSTAHAHGVITSSDRLLLDLNDELEKYA